jgi:hypothetical protein
MNGDEEMSNGAKGKITRGISNQCFVKAFIESELFELYQANREDLFLGVRNEYINIYYNAAAVCKVEYAKRKEKCRCITARKYLYGDGSGYEKISVHDLCDKYAEIKKNIIANKRCLLEKKAQQQLVYRNNANEQSLWYCVDIEYVIQRSNNSEKSYGRFDIIAIAKAKPHRVALIELKYGSGAMGGESGILKHAKDHMNFIEDCVYAKHLKKELVDIVKSQSELKNCSIHIMDECEMADTPEFYFITLDNEDDKPRNTMRRYVLADVKNASKCNVEKKRCVNITHPNEKKYSPVFLFSDNKIDHIEIDDIIEWNQYTRGL